MQRINKILILFIIMMAVSVFTFWKILHSDWVANKTSTVITKYVETKYKAKIQFKGVGLNLFPPGIAVKKVSFAKINEQIDINVGADSIGVYFKAFDVFKTELSINTVEVENGYALIKEVPKTKKSKTKSKKKIEIKESEIVTLLGSQPVKNIKLRDVYVNFNQYSADVKNIHLSNGKNKIDLNANISDVNFPGLTDIINRVDEVKSSLSLSNDQLKINYLNVNDGLSTITVKGNVEKYLSRKIKFNTSARLKAPVRILHDLFEFKDIGELSAGMLSADLSFKGGLKIFDLNTKAELENVVTSFIDADKAVGELSITNREIRFNKLNIFKGKSSIKLLKPVQFYDFDKNLFVEEPLFAEANNAEFSNILKYLSPSTDLIQGKLSGEIRFDLGRNDFHFTALKNVKVNDFRIKAGEELDVFRMKEMNLEEARFDIVGSDFEMMIEGRNETNHFPIKGKINSDLFELSIQGGTVRLTDLNPILDQTIEGEGTFNLKLSQVKEGDLLLSLNSNLRDFDYLGYKLEKLNSIVDINLNTNQLELKRAVGRSGKAILNGMGKVDIKTREVDIGYDVRNLSYSELVNIAPPLLGNFFVKPTDVSGKWTTSGKVTGKVSPEEAIINGKIFGGSTYIYNESIDRFTSKYSLQDFIFKISDVEMSKGKGKIYSDLEYNINKDIVKYGVSLIDVEVADLELYQNIPLNLEAKVSGDLEGVIKKGSHNFDSELRLEKTHVGKNNFENSKLKIKYQDESLMLAGNAFGNSIVADSLLSFNKQKSELSYINAKVDIKDLNKLATILAGVGINHDLEGRLLYDVQTKFDLQTKIIHEINSNVKELSLKKAPVNLSYRQYSPEIIVEDTKVKKWSMNIRGDKVYILSKADGSLGKRLNVTNHFKIDSSILEIFSKYISKANGNLRSKVKLSSTPTKFDYNIEVSSNNLSIASPLTPVPITNGKMFITMSDNRINVKKLKGQLISGSASATGIIDFSDIIPEANLRFNIDNASIPVMQKSTLNFSGDGSFVGKGFPYTLGGDFKIQKFILINEVADFAGGSGGNFLGNEIEYLPESSQAKKKQYFNFNLNITTQEPMYVKNSLADIGFIGNLHVIGGEKDLKMLGTLSLSPRDNLITFKNNEFRVNKADIHFYERNDIYNPELDVLVNSTISNHKVTVKVIGPLKKFDVDFLSEPSLPRNDILSLIAFGYTEDLSTNLTEAEKESMTRAGVGSIIFDSFKINETLKKEFGLQVNLGTEISQKSGSYLSGRNSEGSLASNKVQSSTKFEVKKEINEDVSVSVSSTFGQSSNQKQGLNLNYNVNNNVSLEGIYEAHTSQDAETINSDTSVGADIKLKWSFK